MDMTKTIEIDKAYAKCLESLDSLRLSRCLCGNFEVLAMKLDNQKFRFVTWGKAFMSEKDMILTRSSRLQPSGSSPWNSKFSGSRSSGSKSPSLYRKSGSGVVGTLNLISTLLDKEDKLEQSYGLMRDETGRPADNRDRALLYKFKKMCFEARQDEGPSELWEPVNSWIITNAGVYFELLTSLKELIDSLIVASSDYVKTIQRTLVNSEIRSLSASSLELIANSGLDDGDRMISGIASSHLVAMASTEPPKTPEMVRVATPTIASLDSTGVEGSYFDSSTLPSPSTTDDDSFSAPIMTPATTVAPLDVQERFSAIVERSKETHGEILKMSPSISQLGKRRIITEIKMADEARDHVCLTFIDNDITKVLGTIVGARGTDFEGGIFFVKFAIPDRYPLIPPKCRLITRVFSMHVDTMGKICLDILRQRWQPVWSLCDVLVAFMSILSSPDPRDPTMPGIAALYWNNRRAYDEEVRRHTSAYATGEWPSDEALAIEP